MIGGNIKKLEDLAGQIARTITDGEAARLVLFGLPMRTIFLIFTTLEPTVLAARERQRKKRAASVSEGDEVRGDTWSLSWRIVKKDPAAP